MRPRKKHVSVHPNDGLDLREITCANNPRRGLVTLHAHPNGPTEGASSLNRNILDALGRHDLHSHHHIVEADLRRATAALHAHNIRRLVITGAENLRPDVLEQLLQTAALLDLQIHLIAELPLPRRTDQLLRHHGAQPEPADALLALEPQLGNQIRQPAPWPDDAATDVATLTRTCHEHLPPGAHPAPAPCPAAKNPPGTRGTGTVPGLLRHQLLQCDHEPICCIAALAAAAAHVGLLRHADAANLQTAATRNAEHRTSTGAYTSAVRAMLRAGIDTSDINTLKVSDVAADGSSVSTWRGTTAVPAHDAHHVALQRLTATLNGASPSDTYATDERGPIPWTSKRAILMSSAA